MIYVCYLNFKINHPYEEPAEGREQESNRHSQMNDMKRAHYQRQMAQALTKATH